jgi:hypothetical protein
MDYVTGLMWQRQVSGAYVWPAAIDYCASLTLAGYCDWRLPSRIELASIFDFSKTSGAALNEVFGDAPVEIYYTASPAIEPEGAAFVIYFRPGYLLSVLRDGPNAAYYVRCVR